MEERNIAININQARELLNSGNKQFQEIALQAFSKNELTFDFRRILTLKDACEVLGFNCTFVLSVSNSMYYYSKASAAVLQLNLIRKALNLGQDLHLAKNPKDSCLYYPCNPFITEGSTYYKEELDSGEMEIIGKIRSGGEVYNVLGGFVGASGSAGLGSFTLDDGVGRANAYFGFLGCA